MSFLVCTFPSTYIYMQLKIKLVFYIYVCSSLYELHTYIYITGYIYKGGCFRGLVDRVSDYRSRGPGLESRRYQLF
jgi:hypothetical protein